MQTLTATELEAHAAAVLMGLWRVEEPEAVRALEDAAIELGVRLADLAGLVVATSLVPPGWAPSRGALVATLAGPDDQPSNPGPDDPDDAPPGSVPRHGARLR